MKDVLWPVPAEGRYPVTQLGEEKKVAKKAKESH